VTVNQKLAPAGAAQAGVAWQRLSVVSNTTGTLRVRLTDTAEGGSTIAADAVRIVAVDAETGQNQVVLSALSALSLTDNPLNDSAHDLYIGALRQRLGAGLSVSENAAPVLRVGPLRDGPSRALQFDGVDDFVEVPSSASLDLRRTISVELWMRADGAAAFPANKDWMPLIQKSSGELGARAYSLWLNRDGSIRLTSADAAGEESVRTNASAIQPGQWYHIAGVIDRNAGALRVFVHNADGALIASIAGTVRAIDAITTPMPLEIGRTLEADPTSTPFKGTIDEVQVWNRVRSLSEIEVGLFTHRSGADAGLAGYWGFEEASGQTVFDASPNANHGALGGAPTPLPAGGSNVPGRALQFDGTDDFVMSENLRNALVDDSITLEVWFNAIGPGVIVDELGANTVNNPIRHDSQIEILASGEVLARVWNLPPVSLGTTTFGTWHQAVLRYSGATDTLDGFLDGVKSATNAIGDRSAPFEPGGTGAIFYALGATDTANLGSGASFKGRIDEFRVWNIARTDAEIRADRRVVLSGTEPGLVMYWPLDTIDFLTTPDQSGHGLIGTVLGPTFGNASPTRVYPLIASDDDADPLFISAVSNTDAITPLVADDNLQLVVVPDTHETATITVRVSDRALAGRIDEVQFDFTNGANAIYGSVFADADRNGVKETGEGGVDNAVVFIDANGNGAADLGEPITHADLNGAYAFSDLPLAPRSRTVFTTDFENVAPAQVTGVITTEPVQGYDGLGPDGNPFGGDFLRIGTDSSQTAVATLTLANLPAHTSIDLGFLLAIIDTWDGSGSLSSQPDIFNVTVDGVPIFSESFSNVNQPGHVQGYHPTVPAADLTPGDQRFVDRGFAAVDTVGDAAYDMSVEPRLREIVHTGATLTIQWFASGAGLEPVVNESWAIDNVNVRLNGLTVSPVRIVDQAPPSWQPTTGTVTVGTGLVGTRSVEFADERPIAQGVDFANVRVVNGGADRRVNAGAGVTLTGTVIDPNSADGSNIELSWLVRDAGGILVGTGTGATFSFAPAHAGLYRVLLTATDHDDADRTYQDTVFVAVENVAPAIDTGADVVLDEGQTLTRTLAITDPGADTWTATVDYGDGSEVVPIPAADLADRALDLAHTYADEGTFAVLINVSDAHGGTSSDTLHVTVNNVSPTAHTTLLAPAREGTPIVLTPAVADAGSGDTLSYHWSAVASNGQSIAESTDPTFVFTPNDEGAYSVTLSVTDDDGAVVENEMIIDVSDVAPTVTLAGPKSVPEGSPYVLTIGPVEDPGADTVKAYRVQWGDGTPLQLVTPDALAAAAGRLVHSFADGPATRSISVELVDEDGTHPATSAHEVVVQNVVPTITSLSTGATTIHEGDTVTLQGAFTDPSVLDTHQVRIDWADGTAAQVLPVVAGARAFTATHSYLDEVPNIAQIKVQVDDGVAQSTLATTAVAVRNMAPTFTSLTRSVAEATEGSVIEFAGEVEDTGLADGHWVICVWGDKTRPLISRLGPDGTFSFSHRYDVPGTFQIAATVIDDDGGRIRETRSVTIADVPPVIAPAALGRIAEGVLFTHTGHFSDASGPEDSWSATVQYDDGPSSPLALRPDHSFTLEKVFPDNGTHAITVRVTDRFGQSATAIYNAQVENVEPVIEAGPDVTIRSGATFTRQIDFADSGADTWTAQISFGDGSDPVTLPHLTARTFAFTHLYARAGRFPVTITVTDSDGASATDAWFVDAIAQSAASQSDIAGSRAHFNEPTASAALTSLNRDMAGASAGRLTRSFHASVMLDRPDQMLTKATHLDAVAGTGDPVQPTGPRPSALAPATGVPVPVIDWSVRAPMIPLASESRASGAAWKDDFVSNLGRGEDEMGPNGKMRFMLPIVVEPRAVAPTVGESIGGEDGTA
jgi:hypothetical protein